MIELSPENPSNLKSIVGFENHSGRTYFTEDSNAAPLARVKSGHGNNGEDGYEGAVFNNLFCSYLHGSLLPKNPHLADELLIRALKQQGSSLENFKPLDDEIELQAHEYALTLK